MNGPSPVLVAWWRGLRGQFYSRAYRAHDQCELVCDTIASMFDCLGSLWVCNLPNPVYGKVPIVPHIIDLLIQD